MQDNQSKQPNHKKAIIIIVAALVILAGVVYVGSKASSFMPSHSDFRSMHGGN